LETQNKTIHSIRPYRIFTLLDDAPPDRMATVKIPERRDLWLLETFLLIAAVRLTKARKVFEFGTFFGSTALNLALNSAHDAEIYTFDLDSESAASLQQHPTDAFMTSEHFSRAKADFAGSSVEGKIHQILGNSLTFDFSRWRESMDVIFIDGGHDLQTVTADTQNAFQMARKDRLSCIMWHDYQNPDYPELTKYLERLAERDAIFHVEHTNLCIWFNDPGGHVVPHLKS
jgi:hypothetical protein